MSNCASAAASLTELAWHLGNTVELSSHWPDGSPCNTSTLVSVAVRAMWRFPRWLSDFGMREEERRERHMIATWSMDEIRARCSYRMWPATFCSTQISCPSFRVQSCWIIMYEQRTCVTVYWTCMTNTVLLIRNVSSHFIYSLLPTLHVWKSRRLHGNPRIKTAHWIKLERFWSVYREKGRETLPYCYGIFLNSTTIIITCKIFGKPISITPR